MNNNSIILIAASVLLVTFFGVVLYKLRERRAWEKSLKLPIKKINDFETKDIVVVRKIPTFNTNRRVVAQLMQDYSDDLTNDTPKAWTNAFVVEGIENATLEGTNSYWGIKEEYGSRVFTKRPTEDREIILGSTTNTLQA